MLPDSELLSNIRGSDATPQIEVCWRQNRRVNLPSSDVTPTPFRRPLGRPFKGLLGLRQQISAYDWGAIRRSRPVADWAPTGARSLKKLLKGQLRGTPLGFPYP